jgi:Zn-dependent protease with chaperone function
MKKFHVNLMFFVLSFYCFGAGIMDSFVIYDGWRYVGGEDFATMHIEMGERIISLFVLPMIVLFVFNILQYWFRPAVIPASWVTMALIAQLVGWLSSIFIQIPIQLQLDKGRDEALLEKLIVSDWIRVVAWITYTIIVIAMLNKTISPVNRKRAFA